jgi:hypothetical protein
MAVKVMVERSKARMIPRKPISQKKGMVRHNVLKAPIAEISAIRCKWCNPLRMEIPPPVMLSAAIIGANKAIVQD